MNKDELLKLLETKGIYYKKYEHEPLFSVQDSETKRGEIEGSHTKNLFLKNKKDSFYLLSCEENSIVDLKKLSKAISAGNLSFAREEYLIKHLQVRAGSVSPYALLNDKENKIEFFFEDSLYNKDKINFHPLINTSTITLETSEFINFIIENKKKVNIFSLKDYRITEIL